MERKVETQAKIRKPLKNLLGGWVSFYGILWMILQRKQTLLNQQFPVETMVPIYEKHW
jgi:hypothetical protein